MSDEANPTAVSGWSETTKFADYLLEKCAPIDTFLIALLSGQNEKDYFPAYRSLQILWWQVRPMAKKKEMSVRINQIFAELPARIIELSRLSEGKTRQEIKQDVVARFSEIYSSIWEILISSGIFVRMVASEERLTNEEIFAGITVIPKAKEDKPPNGS